MLESVLLCRQYLCTDWNMYIKYISYLHFTNATDTNQWKFLNIYASLQKYSCNGSLLEIMTAFFQYMFLNIGQMQ
jgi:hypothetical protein